MMYKILIVVDELNQIELIRYNLEKSGFKTLSANDGEQALEIIYGEPLDLLIVDWMMPKMSGIELCQKIRSDKDYKTLPILLVLEVKMQINHLVWIPGLMIIYQNLFLLWNLYLELKLF